YVGLVGFSSPFGLSASLSARLDKDTFDMRRGEVRAAYSTARFSVNGKYAYIQSQPLYGFDDNRAEVSGGASAQLTQNWRVFASATYDLENTTLPNGVQASPTATNASPI